MARIAVKELIGRPIYADKNRVNLRSTPATSSSVVSVFKQGARMGYFGNVTHVGAFDWWGLTAGPNDDNIIGFVRNDVGTWQVADLSKETQGRLAIEQMVQNDIRNYQNLVVAAEAMEKLSANGTDISDSLVIYNQLNDRLRARQALLKQSQNVTILKTIESETGSYLVKKWTDFKGLLGLGNPAAIVAVAAVIVTVAIIGTGYFIWKAFQPKYLEGKGDIIISTDLKNKLTRQLDPATKEQLYKELQDMADKNYNKGKADGNSGGITGTIKAAVMGVGAVVIIVEGKKLFEKHQSKAS